VGDGAPDGPSNELSAGGVKSFEITSRFMTSRSICVGRRTEVSSTVVAGARRGPGAARADCWGSSPGHGCMGRSFIRPEFDTFSSSIATGNAEYNAAIFARVLSIYRFALLIGFN